MEFLSSMVYDMDAFVQTFMEAGETIYSLCLLSDALCFSLGAALTPQLGLPVLSLITAPLPAGETDVLPRHRT